MSLPDAIAQVEHDAPPPMDLATHSASLTGLAEVMAQREQGEAAEPAA